MITVTVQISFSHQSINVPNAGAQVFLIDTYINTYKIHIVGYHNPPRDQERLYYIGN
jgi:hypothetical protein